jgi:hypothetical protein
MSSPTALAGNRPNTALACSQLLGDDLVEHRLGVGEDSRAVSPTTASSRIFG